LADGRAASGYGDTAHGGNVPEHGPRKLRRVAGQLEGRHVGRQVRPLRVLTHQRRSHAHNLHDLSSLPAVWSLASWPAADNEVTSVG
jgi:hypothetical protein